jgi:hypothetical protein
VPGDSTGWLSATTASATAVSCAAWSVVSGVTASSLPPQPARTIATPATSKLNFFMEHSCILGNRLFRNTMEFSIALSAGGTAHIQSTACMFFPVRTAHPVTDS